MFPNGLPLRQLQGYPCPTIVTTDGLWGRCHSASPWQQMPSEPWESPFTRGFLWGRLPHSASGTLPKGRGSRQSGFVHLHRDPFGGGFHTQHLRVPGDPPRRVPAGSPPPPTPLTRTVRVRDAGPGLADYTAGPAPPMAAWKPACRGREPRAGGAGGAAG